MIKAKTATGLRHAGCATRQSHGKTVPNDVTVNALHVYVADQTYPANGDVVFGRSKAKIACSST